MAGSPITPVLLCGGSGTRLWPLSRRSYPKQFVAFFGDTTLFQSAALRFAAEGYAAPVVVTAGAFRFVVAQQLLEAGVEPGAILLEPGPRNTAPAVLAAALQVERTTPGGLMLVVPSDHLIPDGAAFRAAVARGVGRATAGDIVTFGIAPDRAETGYGWLELDAPAGEDAADLRGFVEKPDADRAAGMLKGGRHLWNAGIFLARADAFIAAFERHAPEITGPVRASVEGATADLGFLRLAPGPWEDAPDISVDHAVMEKADNLAVVPFAGAWSDLGSWEGVWAADTPGEDGVATAGPATAIDCADTLLRSEDEDLQVVGIGLRDTIVVAMPDAVLVADKSRTQDVKLALKALEAKGVRQATALPRDYRPWGWFETLSLGTRYQVKKIVVHPGAALSLQSHVHRAEHWVVVAGSAMVTVDDKKTLVSENQSIYVPLGSVHRMENPGKVDLHLIEVQTGVYLGEDDIVRYEDAYRRDAAE